MLGGYGVVNLLAIARERKLEQVGLIVAVVAILILVLLLQYGSIKSELSVNRYSIQLLLLLMAIAATIAFPNIVLNRAKSYWPLLLLAFATIGIFGQYTLHEKTGNKTVDYFTMTPGPRPDYSMKSEAVEYVRLQAGSGADFRIAPIDSSPMAGVQGIYGLEGISGADALVSKHYRELLDASPINRIWGWFTMVRNQELPELDPLLNILSVEYLMSMRHLVPTLYDNAVVHSSDLTIVQRQGRWPRAFFSNEVKCYGTAEELMAMIVQKPSVPIAAVQRQSTDDCDPPVVPQNLQPALVGGTQFTLTPNTTGFSISAPSPGVVVLSEAYYPEFHQAFLNGVRIETFRANHAFIGISIEKAGEYKILVRFRPEVWTLSLYLFSVGLLLFGSMALVMIAVIIGYREKTARFSAARPN